MASLRSYITHNDATQYAGLADGAVVVDVTHSNLKAKFGELRLDKHMTIETVMDKLYRHCGTPTAHCTLLLQTREGATVGILDNDPYSLSANGGLEDVSQVKKYEMSDADYE